MTYQEKLEELYNEFAVKSDAFKHLHILVNKTNGFDDADLIPRYQIAHTEFQIASNEFHNFFSYCKNQNIEMKSEYPII